MNPGTQSGGCQSGSRQPWGRWDGVHRVQYLSFKRAKKIISTKNANLTFVDEGIGLRCVGKILRLECPSDAGER